MKRGDLVTVVLKGDYGKPRPALIVQSDLLEPLEGVLICPITSDIRNVRFRITITPDRSNGLSLISQIMTDKITPVRRSKISAPFGKLTQKQMKAVESALLLVLDIG
ncbi:type II toxin-antitoxin system PemK/MazF family toxin [Bartonella sp. DGB2]|uniref:type II toxin-antitoxin system PemK/MazF family toxin n=1 Tax=Bartonella sp. DGB2 TaxID=3388426 RepID=UPI0039900EF7